MDLESKIEALLFFRGEPTSFERLAEIVDETVEAITEAVDSLQEKMGERGLTVIVKDGEAMLGTAPELGPLIESVVKQELHKDLGRAGLETLSIILYLGPLPKSEVDYIRGVSSTFIVRNLLIRGLVERIDNPKDKRSYLYRPTFELLSYLGVDRIEDLPEYERTREELLAKKQLSEESQPKETDIDVNE